MGNPMLKKRRPNQCFPEAPATGGIRRLLRHQSPATTLQSLKNKHGFAAEHRPVQPNTLWRP